MAGQLVPSVAQCLFVSQPPALGGARQMVDSAGQKASGAADAAENQSSYLSSSQSVVIYDESRTGT